METAIITDALGRIFQEVLLTASNASERLQSYDKREAFLQAGIASCFFLLLSTLAQRLCRPEPRRISSLLS